MSGIVGGVPGKKIAPLTQKEHCGIPGIGHSGTAIAPLLSRAKVISKEELQEKIRNRYINRFRGTKKKNNNF